MLRYPIAPDVEKETPSLTWLSGTISTRLVPIGALIHLAPMKTICKSLWNTYLNEFRTLIGFWFIKSIYKIDLDTTMTPREFFYLVSQMRDAQNLYFSDRCQQNLRLARALEGDVDREIRRVKAIVQEKEISNSINNSYGNTETHQSQD